MMNLPKTWFVVANSHEIYNKKPTALKRFNLNLVLWRHNDQIMVFEDKCPHRGSKLSLGQLKNGNIECPFHGFQFDQSGQCDFIPEINHGNTNLCLNKFVAIEQNNFIYISLNPHTTDYQNIPWFDELAQFKHYSHYSVTWPCHITRCIENQLDYAHLPFVHKTTIGRNVKVSNNVKFELTDASIKMYTNPQNLEGSYFNFKFGNIWLLNILSGKFLQFLAFVPIDENNTKLYVRTYHNFVTIPFIIPFINFVLNIQSQVILNQDKGVVISQKPLNSITATSEKLYVSDNGIKHFRDTYTKLCNL